MDSKCFKLAGFLVLPYTYGDLWDGNHDHHRSCFHLLFLLALTLSTLEETRAQPCPKTWDNAGQFNVPSFFFPFDPSADGVVPPSDDGSSPQINLTMMFPLFGQFHTSAYIDTNGIITFDDRLSSFDAISLPIQNFVLIGPFFIDIDTNLNSGRIYYRQTTNPLLLCRISAYVREKRLDIDNFEATWVFIVTWHNVTYFGGSTNTPVNTFQVVLATDGQFGFSLFNYGDITWTTGTSTNGSEQTGLGGIPAQVGLNSGSSNNFFTIPISKMPTVVNLDTLPGNTNDIARWLFRTDTPTITDQGSKGLSTVSIRENRAVTLNCPSAGVKFSSRSWNRGLLNIVGPYTLLYKQLKSGTVSSDGARQDMSLNTENFQLTIDNPQAIEDVNFTCSVLNEETQMRTLDYIRLKYDGVDTGQSNLVPIAAGAGGGGGLVLIIVIVISIILCRRRRAKTDTLQGELPPSLEDPISKWQKSGASGDSRNQYLKPISPCVNERPRPGHVPTAPDTPNRAALDLPDLPGHHYDDINGDDFYEEVIKG